MTAGQWEAGVAPRSRVSQLYLTKSETLGNFTNLDSPFVKERVVKYLC